MFFSNKDLLLLISLYDYLGKKILTPALTSYLNLELLVTHITTSNLLTSLLILRLRKNKLPYIFIEEAIFVVIGCLCNTRIKSPTNIKCQEKRFFCILLLFINPLRYWFHVHQSNITTKTIYAQGLCLMSTWL